MSSESCGCVLQGNICDVFSLQVKQMESQEKDNLTNKNKIKNKTPRPSNPGWLFYAINWMFFIGCNKARALAEVPSKLHTTNIKYF